MPCKIQTYIKGTWPFIIFTSNEDNNKEDGKI